MLGRDIARRAPWLLAAGFGLLAIGCGGSNAERRGQGPLLASGPGARGMMAETTEPMSQPSAEVKLDLAEQMLRDPGDRVMFMERMRRQILHKTRAIPQPRYMQRVRPDLQRQLMAMGFDQQDAELILSDVDRAR